MGRCDEGEGERTRDWQLDAHCRYFARQASREGFELDDDILTVFERFEVVWPLDGANMITDFSLDLMGVSNPWPTTSNKDRKAGEWHTISTARS
jgi:hypothetical protein